METEFIAVLDSGIGGLSVLKELIENSPNENYLYYSDWSNAPYGNKPKRLLSSLTFNNLTMLSSCYPLKAAVLACNTLSVSVLYNLRQYFPFPIFGTFPPIETCVVKGEKTLLLSTEVTASYYRYNGECDVLGFSDLARKIESSAMNLEALDFSLCIDRCCDGQFVNEKGYYDTIILGCTHYEFIKYKIFDHFCPKKIISGVKFTSKAVLDFIKNHKSSVINKRKKLLFVGCNAMFNKDFFYKSGQNVLF